jgi:hypothetical protein
VETGNVPTQIGDEVTRGVMEHAVGQLRTHTIPHFLRRLRGRFTAAALNVWGNQRTDRIKSIRAILHNSAFCPDCQ